MGLQYFKALADETRLRLANILLHYELSVNEIVQIMKMGQSRVSRHLKILLDAGLLVSRRDGLWVFYQTPKAGRARNFLEIALPFAFPATQLEGDLALAAKIMEERVLRARQFFNSVAEHWDALKTEILGDFDISSSILPIMPSPCETAVDLGCGTGGVLSAMRGRARSIVGVDGSPKMLELCKRRFAAERLPENSISLRIGELSHLPLADNEANFACLNLVLHHLPNPAISLKEVRRIMAPDGLIFLSEFLRHNDETMRVRYGDHWLGFEEKEIAAYLEYAGFELRNISRCAVKNGHALLLVTAKALPNQTQTEMK